LESVVAVALLLLFLRLLSSLLLSSASSASLRVWCVFSAALLVCGEKEREKGWVEEGDENVRGRREWTKECDECSMKG
jgi:hypothetical protein